MPTTTALIGNADFAITASVKTELTYSSYVISLEADSTTLSFSMNDFDKFSNFCKRHNLDIDPGSLSPTRLDRLSIIDKGYWIHPVILTGYNDTTTITELIKERSEGKLTSETILFDNNEIPPNQIQCVDEDPEDPVLAVLSWKPKPQHPDGFLVALYDDEDTGPTAVFAVPADKTHESGAHQMTIKAHPHTIYNL